MTINVYSFDEINRVHRHVRRVDVYPKPLTTLLEITYKDNTKFTDCIVNEEESFTIRKESKV